MPPASTDTTAINSVLPCPLHSTCCEIITDASPSPHEFLQPSSTHHATKSAETNLCFQVYETALWLQVRIEHASTHPNPVSDKATCKAWHCGCHISMCTVSLRAMDIGRTVVFTRYMLIGEHNPSQKMATSSAAPAVPANSIPYPHTINSAEIVPAFPIAANRLHD